MNIAIVTISIWCLLACAIAKTEDVHEAKAGPPQAPTVFLNHVQLVLDAETYAAITKSEFLQKELGSITTIRSNQLLLAFHQTFLEFFGPGRRPPREKEGDGGICFSVDRLSDLQLAFDSFSKLPGASPRRETSKAFDGKTPFNDYVVSRDYSTSRFWIWVSAYRPEFFTLLKIPIPETGELTREALKANQRQRNKAKNEDPLGGDIIAVTVALGDEEAEHLDGEMAALGYAKVREAGAIEYHGPEFTLRVKPASASKPGYQVIGVKIALRREPKEVGEHHFGARSVLRISKDRTADWVFE